MSITRPDQTISILLVEDNLTIARQLTEFLEGHGWLVDYTASGVQAISLAAGNIYDLAILDLNLPDMDGLDVCAHIKESAETNIPVLMLTARDAFEDKARGFGQGADDYVTKPFEFRELALRCLALTRRGDLHRSKQLMFGDLVIDLTQKTALREQQSLDLTAIGFRILVQLAQAYPNPLSRSVLLHRIWGDTPPDSEIGRAQV